MKGEGLCVALLLNALQLDFIHYLIKIQHFKNKTFRRMVPSLSFGKNGRRSLFR